MIRTGKKVYRPPLPSTCTETEISEDLNDGMEWVLRDYGLSLKQTKYPLPPRYDRMEFDVQTNTKESEKNLKLQDRPSDLQDKVKEVVTEYWGVFCEDGFRQPIPVFSFQIDTGIHSPIWCKTPRCGPHDYEVMRKLVERLDENGVVEEDSGTWRTLVVISAKPHQENVPLHKYQWRLCVSYQKLIQVTRPFTLPITCFDDSVQYIDIEAKYLLLWTWTVVIGK